jgi:hypothetical protein
MIATFALLWPMCLRRADSRDDRMHERPRSPLQRFHAGELDLDGYLDAKIEEATSHLRGLPRADLELVRSILREFAETDPALAELLALAIRIPDADGQGD